MRNKCEILSHHYIDNYVDINIKYYIKYKYIYTLQQCTTCVWNEEILSEVSPFFSFSPIFSEGEKNIKYYTSRLCTLMTIGLTKKNKSKIKGEN